MSAGVAGAGGVGTADACAALAEQLGEDLAGSAPHVLAWLLVEQPGPWGRKAPGDSRLAPAVAEELARRASGLPALRVQLIRRPGPGQGGAGGRRARSAFVCRSDPAGGWIRRVTFTDPAALLDLDLAALVRGAAPGGAPPADGAPHPGGAPPGDGAPHPGPLYLVCTNGARDPCCALRGRALVTALLPALGDTLWETTHVGGHRFAGNLVCLPDGTYYGRLEADRAAEVVREHRAGRLALAHLRGRSSLPGPAQAADVHVRRERDLRGSADVTVEGVEEAGDGWIVRLGVRGEEVAVGVRSEATRRPRPVSCGADPEDPGRFVCRDLGADGAR